MTRHNLIICVSGWILLWQLNKTLELVEFYLIKLWNWSKFT